MPHLQLPAFLPMTAKANGSHSSAFPLPKDQLSNRMRRTSPPSPAPLWGRKKKKKSHQTQLGPTAGSLPRLERLLGLGPKERNPDSPVRAHRYLRAHLPQAGSPSPLSTKDLFWCKSYHTIDGCRQSPACLQTPCAESYPRQCLKEITSVCGAKGKKQNFHSLTPTVSRFLKEPRKVLSSLWKGTERGSALQG